MVNHLSFDVLSQLVDGRASTLADPRAARHLASCSRCRSELAWLQRIRAQPEAATSAESGWGQQRLPQATI